MKWRRILLSVAVLTLLFSITAPMALAGQPGPKEGYGDWLGSEDNPDRLFLYRAVLNACGGYDYYWARGSWDLDGDGTRAIDTPENLGNYAMFYQDCGSAFYVTGRSEPFEVSGDPYNDPPLFAFAGWQGRESGGIVLIMTTDPDQDGYYEGWANGLLLRNFGFPIQQQDTTAYCEALDLCGEFIEMEVMRGFYDTDEIGLATYWGFDEYSMRKHIDR